jgi:hypothetical protein
VRHRLRHVAVVIDIAVGGQAKILHAIKSRGVDGRNGDGRLAAGRRSPDHGASRGTVRPGGGGVATDQGAARDRQVAVGMHPTMRAGDRGIALDRKMTPYRQRVTRRKGPETYEVFDDR